MANKLITGLTTTQILCGSDYMVFERLTGTNPATTYNCRLSSVLEYVKTQPVVATISDGTVTESKISNNSISTLKLQDRSVTTIKIAQNAVTGYELASNSVSAVHISNNAVTVDKLNPNIIKVNGGLQLDSTNGVSLYNPISSYIVNSTLRLSDANCIIEANNASAMTITIPTNGTTPFPIGTNIVLYQKGVGQVTIAGASGVTLLTTNGRFKTAMQNSAVALFKVAVDTWLLGGDLV